MNNAVKIRLRAKRWVQQTFDLPCSDDVFPIAELIMASINQDSSLPCTRFKSGKAGSEVSRLMS